MANNDISPIVFIPIALCLLGILILLDIYNRQRQAQSDESTAIAALRQLQDDNNDEDFEPPAEVAEENDLGEGSSTSVHIKKIGKKKGEKLRRKEQMRQYREYMEHQRQLRRAQDEVLEEEFRRRKAEEAIRREEEAERRRKELAKKKKQQEKELEKKRKAEEKERQKKRARFDKYNKKIATKVKELKLCSMEMLGKAVGLSAMDAEEILRELCRSSSEYKLSLWSGEHFMYIEEKDYERIGRWMEKRGKISVQDGGENLLSILKE